jgi:lincosamide nucleotidyltransferase A/C/D/E
VAGVPAPLSASHLLDVLHVLDAAGIAVSVEGGWGVDALLGRQTRDHADVDLALDRNDCEAAASALAARGYRHDMSDRPGLPARFVLKNEAGLKVDFHPLVFDAEGNGWQELENGGWGLHEGRYLRRGGTIDGRPVSCIAPELQLAFRLGYPLSEKDRHDLRLLAAEFGIPLPPSVVQNVKP